MQTKNTVSINNVVFNTEVAVRISDINYGNHLGHDSLISLLHDARVQFLNKFGYTELNVCGFGVLMVGLSVNYLAQVFYPDDLVVEIGIGEKTKSTIELLYRVASRQKEKEIASASTTMAFYDYDKKRVVRIPEDLLTKIDA